MVKTELLSHLPPTGLREMKDYGNKWSDTLNMEYNRLHIFTAKKQKAAIISSATHGKEYYTVLQVLIPPKNDYLEPIFHYVRSISMAKH